MSDLEKKDIEKAQQGGQAAGEERSLEDAANCLSYASLSFLNPLFRKGYQSTLEHSDLGSISQQDRSDLLYARFIEEWEKERKKPVAKRSLWFVLWRTVGFGRFAMAILLYTIYTAESFGPILILNRLVQHFQGTHPLSRAGLWVCVALIFVLPMTGSIFAAHSNILLAHIGLQFRDALVNMIYRKALRLSASARQMSSTGQVVNMLSTDTAQIQRFVFFMNNMFLAIPTIAICLLLIYFQVGPATFVGLGLIIVIMPLNASIFLLLSKLRRKKVQETDRRVKLMNEILNGIRIIKYYAWEVAFEEKVQAVRGKELELLKKMAYVVAIAFTIILQAVPVFLPVLIFFTYVKLGNRLDAAKAFTTISLFNLMQFPFVFLPMGFSQYSQSLVSSKRMLDFFDSEELPEYVERNEKPSGEDGVVIAVTGASLGWTDDKAIQLMKEKKEKEAAEKAAKAKAQGKQAPSKEKQGKKYEAVSTTEDTKNPSKEAPVKESMDSPIDEKDSKTNKNENANSDQGLEMTMVASPETTSVVIPAVVNRSIHTLRDISFSIKQGQLVAVVGSVGSGKSSLLSAMLGEMMLQQGRVSVFGSIAYCDQRPWILNDTVKGNILFGLPYDEAKFDLAMHAANLEDDIKVLPGGVETQIGERGINLSGGQKARVALARAVYRDADIYLLDDPLSAVDAHVGQFLFHECIRSALKGKTRVLVTHQVHFLPYCDQIIILDEGNIKAVGSYAEITQSGLDVDAYIPAHLRNKPIEATVEETTNNQKMEQKDSKDAKEKSQAAAALRKNDTRSTTIISKEERGSGDVTSAVYFHYIKAGGMILFLSFLAFVIIGQLFAVLGAYWLQYWGSVSVDKTENNNPLSSSQNLFYLNIYAALACASLFSYIMRSVLLANHRLGTSEQMHKGLVHSTLRAPVAFFDTTPVGRILNRFSSDMQSVDEEISQSISQASNSFASVIGAIGAIAGATKGTFLILMVPLMYFYYSVQRYFRYTNTTIARLESVSRSPMYTDFSQALSGVNSVRAYKEERRFIHNLEKTVNNNSVANITQQLSSQWLAIRLDFMGALISFFIAVVAAASDGFIPAGFVAVGLTYSFQLTTYFKFLVRMLASVEAQFNSVERIKQYMENIDQEGSTTASAISEVPVNWPEQGEIIADQVELRYRDGPLALKGLNFHVNGTEKIGVAGRTGSGKSSMMVALFRIQELAAGKITIDGLDIASVPLHILRSKLGIIPQDPVMFSASVRFNLDPFNQSSDAEVWQVLESVNMKEHVLSLPNKLSEEVSEGGDNFSAGQRQLICIARAILRKPKILVLDEATASIDNETDAVIQRMIREQFRNCTVLTIAHRLNTIIDSDRIMVLDSGVIAEMDSPQKLLELPDGMFKQLWNRHLEAMDIERNLSRNIFISFLKEAIFLYSIMLENRLQ